MWSIYHSNIWMIYLEYWWRILCSIKFLFENFIIHSESKYVLLFKIFLFLFFFHYPLNILFSFNVAELLVIRLKCNTFHVQVCILKN